MSASPGLHYPIPRFHEGQRLTAADLNALVDAINDILTRVAKLEADRAPKTPPPPSTGPIEILSDGTVGNHFRAG